MGNLSPRKAQRWGLERDTGCTAGEAAEKSGFLEAAETGFPDGRSCLAKRGAGVHGSRPEAGAAGG